MLSVSLTQKVSPFQGGQDKHSIVADPKFKDAAQGDYTLLPDSPALAHGFTQIDMSTVGPRPAARTVVGRSTENSGTRGCGGGFAGLSTEL